MFRFEHIEYLYALLLIPFFSTLFILFVIWKNRAIRKFGEWQVIAPLMPLFSTRKIVLKFIILMFAYASLVIALANPQIGSKLEKVQRKGADLVIALDVSNSMLSQDIRPDRLTRAVQGISKPPHHPASIHFQGRVCTAHHARQKLFVINFRACEFMLHP